VGIYTDDIIITIITIIIITLIITIITDHCH